MSSHDLSESNAGAPEADGLPFEPDSISELLSATHLFTVEVASFAATPWTTAADGLEHRSLDMTFRLLALYKGRLDVQPEETFPLNVEQRRESEFFNHEFYGLWSHVEPQPEVGVRYVVVSQGATGAPAALMQEGACRRLLTPEYESDILLAREAERLFRRTLDDRGQESPTLSAARALLNFTQERRAVGLDLFALYLWARVQPPLLQAPEVLLPEALALALSPDARTKFRLIIVASVYEAALLFAPDSPPYQLVLRALLTLLTRPEAAPLHETLVEVQLYNLLFQNSVPRFPRAGIVPDAAERGRLRDALAPFASERAQRIKVWLNSGP
jgi:hypothetical protein